MSLLLHSCHSCYHQYYHVCFASTHTSAVVLMLISLGECMPLFTTKSFDFVLCCCGYNGNKMPGVLCTKLDINI